MQAGGREERKGAHRLSTPPPYICAPLPPPLPPSLPPQLPDEQLEKEGADVVRQLALGARGILNPMAAFLGGVVGQEVLKVRPPFLLPSLSPSFPPPRSPPYFLRGSTPSHPPSLPPSLNHSRPVPGSSRPSGSGSIMMLWNASLPSHWLRRRWLR